MRPLGVRGVAEPARGTVRRTALCRWCGEVLYHYGIGWGHDDGDGHCDRDAVEDYERKRHGGPLA
jgi:hypothetical protein